MVQTPQQRKANEKFAKRQEKVMGKPESAIKKKEKAKLPVSKTIIGVLVFLVCGGFLFEALSRLLGYGGAFT